MVGKSQRGGSYVIFPQGNAPTDRVGMSLEFEAKENTQIAASKFAGEVSGNTITRISFDEHQCMILFSSGHYINIYFKIEFSEDVSSKKWYEFSLVDSQKSYGFMASLGKMIKESLFDSDRSICIILEDGLIIRILKSEEFLESYTLNFPDRGGFVTI